MAKRKGKGRRRAARKSAPARRRRSGRASSGRSHSPRRAPSQVWRFVKAAGATLVGGTIGALATPFLPEAVSGAALGMAVGGLAVGGFHPASIPFVASAVAVQGVKTIERTKQFEAAQVAVIEAADKIKIGSGSRSASNDVRDAIGSGAAALLGEKAIGGGIANDIRQLRKVVG